MPAAMPRRAKLIGLGRAHPMNEMARAAKIAVYLVLAGTAAIAQPQPDPAAWGSNHAGQPIPEYIDGEQCLFCHRSEIGSGWQANRHARTIRPKFSDPQDDAEHNAFLLGSRQITRELVLLRPGVFSMGTAQGADPKQFGERCAGCHSSAVDPESRTFYSIGIDCFTCHGDVSLEHTNDTSLVQLSKKNRGDARVIVSICGQCHLRGGRSRSTKLPFPNNFIAGDNLFQDFEVDFALANESGLSPADRHVYENVRDVAVLGETKVDCLTCHLVHADSGNRHRRVLRNERCFTCHENSEKLTAPPASEVHGETCEY